MGIRKRNSIRPIGESELPIVPFVLFDMRDFF